MFYVGEWALELINCLLYVLKCDFDNVGEAMFHVVERIFQRIFYIQAIENSDLDKVA
jgi:hypothetical protein